MKIILTIISICFLVNSFGQTLSGKIEMSDKWERKFFVIPINHINIFQRTVIDSIKIAKDGSFKYSFLTYNQHNLLYIVVLPPAGGNFRSSVGIPQDNYFIVSTEAKEDIELQANSDSLYFTLKLISKRSKLNSNMLKYRDLKKPLYYLFKKAMDSAAIHPEATLQIKQRLIQKLAKELEKLKVKIKQEMDETKNISMLMVGLCNMNEAYLGHMEGSVIKNYTEKLKPFSDILIVKNTLKLSDSIVTNRLNHFIPEVSLKNYSGKIVPIKSILYPITVIDFWASWCNPCRKANRDDLPYFYKKYKDKVNLIGVSIDTDTLKWRAAVKKDNTSWPQYLDEQTVLRNNFSINAVPTYLVVDHQRKIVFEAPSIFQVENFLNDMKR